MRDLLDRLNNVTVTRNTACDAIEEINESRRCTERLAEAFGCDVLGPNGAHKTKSITDMILRQEEYAQSVRHPTEKELLGFDEPQVCGVVAAAAHRLASKPTVVCAEFHNGLKDLASRIAAEDHRPTLADAVNELCTGGPIGDDTDFFVQCVGRANRKPNNGAITTDQVEAMKADGVTVRFVDSIDVMGISAVSDPVNPSCRVIGPAPTRKWDGSEPLAVGMHIEHGVVEALSDRDVCVRYYSGGLGMYLRQNIKPIQDDAERVAQSWLVHVGNGSAQYLDVNTLSDTLRLLVAKDLITINGVK